ncbi:DegT/DnrJ/EryC1/StrS family aminotransferase [Mesorhizobium sp. M0025]
MLKSDRWTLSGPFAGSPSRERLFAKAFSEFIGVPYCTPTTSGTSAITLALLALGIGPGYQVILPGLTWVACASAVVCVGAEPVLADITEHNLAISPDGVEAAITDRTKAVLVVHPYCRLADIESLRKICDRHGLYLIEDCSQAHGAKYKGQRVGSFGDISCFSMQQSKVLTAGEGGAALTHDRALWRRMEQLRCDGRTYSATSTAGRLELTEVGDVLGQNACMNEFQAAILLDRLPWLDSENEERRNTARDLYLLLGNVEGITPLLQNEECEYTYYNMVLHIDRSRFDNASIDLIAFNLAHELQAQVSPVYRPMHRHRLYTPLSTSRIPWTAENRERFDPAKFTLPVADYARSAYLTLPHHLLLDGPRGANDIAAAFSKLHALRSELASQTFHDDSGAF